MPTKVRGSTLQVSTSPQLSASVAFDPPSLVAGGYDSTSVSVPGAVLGDFARASFSLDLAGVSIHAYVSTAGTVMLIFKNNTAAVVNLGAGTLRVLVDPAGV